MWDMWLDFKAKGVVIVLMCFVFTANAQQSKVVYNLRQNWVEYNEASKGFLPAVSNKLSGAISFELDCSQYRGKKLFIYTNAPEAYLFYNNVLIANLNGAGSYFDVDSLASVLGSTQPLLTLFRSAKGEGVETLIVEKDYVYEPKEVIKHHTVKSDFTSFFIIVSILLYIGLTIIKVKYPELFNQYASLQRSFNPQTIDELIYKGRFFTIPGIIMIIWMSLASGFILSYLINKLDVVNLGLIALSTPAIGNVFTWLILSAIFLFILLIRYGLIAVMASIFDMSNVRNIHFASYLRLTFYLLVILLLAITLEYFSIIAFGKTFILWLVFASLTVIIAMIGIRLSLIIRHTFVHLFLYLCATEIFLFAFVYKLVVG